MGIVMRSKSRSIINDSFGWEWHIVVHPLAEQWTVTRDEALSYIKKHHLEKAYTLLDEQGYPEGYVWDTPSEAFRKTYGGAYLRDSAHQRRFNEIWK